MSKKKKSSNSPMFVTDDRTTEKLERQHAQVQADIEALPEDKRTEVRALQAQVDAEIAKVNFDMDEQFEIEAKWRNATGLHHSQAEEVLRTMGQYPVGKIKEMYGKQWVHTPFKTIVQAQVYVDVLQDRLLSLIGDVGQETTIHQLLDYRSKLLVALKDSVHQTAKAEAETRKFTKLSALGLMKLSIQRLFKRGNNG